MNFKSEVTKSYRILYVIGALIWLGCALVCAAVLYMVWRIPEKGAWQFFLIVLLAVLAAVLLLNACTLFAQLFKSLEITEHGEKVTLIQLGKRIPIRPEEISQVRIEEKYLWSSFSTKPRKMLVIEAPGVRWQVRSDILTSYDRLLNYFEELDQE